MVDSIVYADSQSKILDIESKYNHLKISKEVDRLKIKQQSYIIISIICIITLLFIMVGYLLYRKKAKEKIQRQRDELNQIKENLLYVSLELEKKKRLSDTLKEKNENYNKMQEGIEKAGEKVRILTDEAIGLLQELPGEKEFLTELLISLCTRRK